MNYEIICIKCLVIINIHELKTSADVFVIDIIFNVVDTTKKYMFIESKELYLM